MQDWTSTMSHGVRRKRRTKRLKHTENLFRKNVQFKGEFQSLALWGKNLLAQTSS